MTTWPSEVSELAEAIQAGIAASAGSGRPEAVLREHVQPALRDALTRRGVRATARDEFRLTVPTEEEAHVLDAALITGGRADAIYNRFVIEFEPPGSLRASVVHSATRHAVSQVQQYLRGLSEHGRLPLERLAGCAFDGSWVIYVTFDAGDWRVSRPRQVDADVLSSLIATLESLSSGRGLTAENLFEDFGPQSDAASKMVPALVDVLTADPVPERANAFYEQWRLDLSSASGLPSDFDVPDWLELCEALGLPPETSRRPAVLFALQTYFGIVAKLVCLVVLEGATGKSLLAGLTNSQDVWEGFDALESGALTASTGALNAVEPGIFSWYLAGRTPAMTEALQSAALLAAEYSAEMIDVTLLAARDLMKDLFQRLLPRSLRHRLGEYYTPDWLADFVLNEVSYEGDPALRLLDPACGSGTFLVLAIARIREWYEANHATCGFGEDVLLDKILRAVSGFDLSPLAVIAARTNYLIAIRDLLKHANRIEIPVYLCDSVLTPVEYGDLFTGGHGRTLELKTSAARFLVPTDVAQDRANMATYASILQESVNARVPFGELLERLDAAGISVEHRDAHENLFEQLRALDAADLDGIWANIIENAFAPLFNGQVDIVVGNPPWVFWNTLPTTYRDEIRSVMVDRYKLAAGAESTMKRLGAAGKDLSALFVYVALDRYLRHGGKLGFVITQTVFQSTAATEFRKWTLPDDVPVKVVTVDDWVAVAPFASATNKTATFVVQKGEPTKYPVKYRVWEPVDRFDRDSATLTEVTEKTTRRDAWAHPSDPTRAGSLWLISDSATPHTGASGLGTYRARLGVETKLEAVYRVRLKDQPTSTTAHIENIRDRAKIPVDATTAEIELDLLHPYVTGASIGLWNASSPGLYVVPHTKETGIRPIGEDVMRSAYPRTYAYLARFRSLLENRSLHKRWGKGNPFYALYDIGPYTFSPWKVVWKRTTRKFEAAVVSSMPVGDSSRALVVPNGKVMMIPFDSEDEAHYVCAVLNSSLARARINSAISSEAHAELLGLVHLPRFNPENKIHRELADASVTCHTCVSEGSDVERSHRKVDRLTAKLWKVNARDLAAAQSVVDD